MVDRQRVLAKLDELDGYVRELLMIVPNNLAEYRGTVTKRACERLLQLSIESTIDVCKKLVIGDHLGLPSDEVDLFEKLRIAKMLPEDMFQTLRKMRGLRNVLVHEYAEIDDQIIFAALKGDLGSFGEFKTHVLAYLRK